ncbi:MAG: M48 family metalloprotease [Acidobacteria bacterium]|nr:M48 family metalloprotease [Acidobacteriota bacterium]
MVLTLILSVAAFGQRTALKPGWNLFSPAQDVELGRQVAQDAERQLPMLNQRRVDDYLDRLGKRLAGYAPGEKYPYQFKCVNDASINAFALPGGFLYIHRGLIEAADNEAELAGVIGHEIGHVALRHGTNQASKQQLYQAPLAIFGGIMGNDSMAGALAQIGAAFTVNSILLKYSRDDEREADLIGSQILYDAGYDPRSMATFFEKLETGNRGTDFFSSHPNPDNRIRGIQQEIARLGPLPARAAVDSRDFQNIRRLLQSLPPAPQGTAAQQSQPGASTVPAASRPEPPSSRLRSYDSGYVRLQHPDNWRVYGEERDFALAPDGGIVTVGNEGALAYGGMMAVYEPVTRRGAAVSLKDATDQLVARLQRSNPGMRLMRDRGQIRVGGQVALSMEFVNGSPSGGQETDWLVTLVRPEGLVYFIFVAPEEEYASYRNMFQRIVQSVRF